MSSADCTVSSIDSARNLERMFQPGSVFRLGSLQFAHRASRAVLLRLSLVASLYANDGEREAGLRSWQPVQLRSAQNRLAANLLQDINSRKL